MVKSRKFVVKNTFHGEPKFTDYEIVINELPALNESEILVKTEWLGIDPLARYINAVTPTPYDQAGFQVGVVQESKNPDYAVGSRVVSFRGWCEYYVIKPDISLRPPHPDSIYKIPDLQGYSPSLAVGAIGMPGATAYLAFINICKPKAGDTVVITGAAGSVGSLVGQIAKAKGCKVIGFAGSQNKVERLEQELGFDKAYNYKTVDIIKALKEAAPDGVDCYFDNVGGEISSQIMYQMKKGGRVAVVGSISSYNDDPSTMAKVTILQPAILTNALRVEGFHIWDVYEQWSEAFVELVKLMKTSNIKAKEHVTEGFENTFEAFLGLLRGENFGKAVVKV